MGKQNLITAELMAISGILLSILVSMVAFRQFTLPISQADLTAARAGLAVPYVRLQALDVEPGSSTVDLELLINTGGQPVLGTDVKINYDQKMFSLKKESIRSTDALDSIHLNALMEGSANVSFFASKIASQSSVMTNADQELPIAIFRFERIDPSLSVAQFTLDYSPGSLDETNLVLDEEPRPEFPTDIIKAVEGAVVTF